MVDSTDRTLRGKTGLWRDLDTRRQRPFLRRNLNHILDQHELLLLASKRDPDAIKAEMIANERRQAGWDFPTPGMLEGQKPALNIIAIQLRHPNSNLKETPLPSRRKRISGDPNWLPHPDDGYALSCQVTVAVTDPRASGKRIYADSRHAVVHRCVLDDGYPAFDIRLDDRFACELDKLFVVEEIGCNGHRTWKRTATAKYTLDISILCEDPDDTADLLSQLEGRPRESYVNAPASDGALNLVWTALPECPTDAKLLPLQRSKGHKVLQLQYGAEVFMGWTRRRQSALVLTNRQIRREQDVNWQLATPSASDDQERPRNKLTITYIWKEGPQHRVSTCQGLECIFCVNRGEHSSFERLHLHYLTHHDHFRYEVNHDKLEDHKAIEITRSQPDSNSQNDRNFDWLAPERPFDISKFVNGEEAWSISEATTVSKTKVGARRGKLRREPEADHSPAPPRERRKHIPTEVKDLARPWRKRNSVPNVPGVRFYRTTSKQLVDSGAVISDSDDDIDDRWLEQSQRRNLVQMGLTGAELAFWEVWNRRLEVENPSNDNFVTDFVVRLARTEQPTLQNPAMYVQFRSQLEMLHRQSVLEEETVAYCLEHTAPTGSDNFEKLTSASTRLDPGRDSYLRNPGVLGTQQSHRSYTSESGELVIEESPERSRAVTEKSAEASTPNTRKKRRNRWKEGRMEFVGPESPHQRSLSREMSTSLGLTATPDARRCICGERVMRLQDAVACSNPSCERDFHLACVNLERGRKRDMNWQCRFCAP